MVKKSSKSKSKRTSIKKKHKIMKKVNAHNRKERRAQRRKVKENKAKGIKTGLKDPGVPASWPFRDEFLKEMGFEKERILQEKKAKKAQNKKEGEHDADLDVNVLAESVQKKVEAFQFTSETESQLGLTSDAHRRTDGHYNYFCKVVGWSDVILVVLDARDPEGCRCKVVEHITKEMKGLKKIVYLLNKTDLVPREVVESWMKHLRQFAPTIAFKCSTQRQRTNLGQSRNRTMESKSSVCLGADNLIQLLKNYARSEQVKTSITVGVVGLPNVGKSSVINSLKRSKATHVGNRPGVTTNIQEVHLDKQIRLLDSPGVVYHATCLLDVGNGKVEDVVGAVESISDKIEAETLKGVYGIGDFEDVQSFLQLVAQKTGKLKKGGIADIDAAAQIVIQDWNNGKIPFYTLPPSQSKAHDVQIVEAWTQELHLNPEDSALPREMPVCLPEREMDLQTTEELAVPGAMEAFSRMDRLQETRAVANKAIEALHDMNIHETKEPSPVEEKPQKVEPTVKVLYRRGQNRTKRSSSCPVHRVGVNMVKPPAVQKKALKKKAKKLKNRAIKNLANMAKDLKL